MQPAVVSQSNREDEKPRFILLASLENGCSEDRVDSRHLRADYRPLASRLQVEQNVGPNSESKRRAKNRRVTLDIHVIALRELAL